MSAKYTFLFFTFLICMPLALIGQNESMEVAKSVKVKEIALNTTTIFNNFLNFSDTDVPLSAYPFSYKSIGEDGKAFRLGAGLSLNTAKGPDFSTDFFTEDLKTTSVATDLRLGFEKQKKITERWVFYSGMDLILGFDHFKFESEEEDFKSTQRRIEYGLGPVMGIQFMFSERIGLFTESTLYLSRRNSKRTSDGNFSDDELKSSANNLNFLLPSNIYFFMRF